jgi:signal transduction histidine kinase
VYRLVQEALHNSTRHSGAQNVRIRVSYGSGWLHLSVQDDGQGFDANREKGLGLLGMEERVKHLNGTFKVDSKPGGGTAISVALPLSAISEDSK